LELRTPGISGKLNLLAPWRIRREAAAVGADVIHTHLSTAGLWGSVAGRMAGIPVVAHVHALNSRFCFRFSEMIATCSEGVRQHIVAQGEDPNRVQVVYNGLDLCRFEGLPTPGEVLSGLGIPDGSPVIGCIAHLSAKKGQEYLIRAVSILSGKWPGLHCLLIGEGHLISEYRELAQSLGVAERVRLLGYRADAIALMKGMDVVVLPSVAKEGLGLALIEAAFLGKPTIGSQAPGIDEAIMNNVTGFLVPPADPEALACRIDQLLADPPLRMRLGEAGNKRANEMFTAEAMAERMEGLYRRLLEPRP
jgi:glycosyltransferase involved in cell wall biosynthesis